MRLVPTFTTQNISLIYLKVLTIGLITGYKQDTIIKKPSVHLDEYIHLDVIVWYINKLPTTMSDCLFGEVCFSKCVLTSFAKRGSHASPC